MNIGQPETEEIITVTPEEHPFNTPAPAPSAPEPAEEPVPV